MIVTQYDWRFYESQYIHTVDGKIAQQDTIYSYSNGGPLSPDQIKQQVRDSIDDQSAVISLPLITEISHEVYVEKAKNDPMAKYR